MSDTILMKLMMCNPSTNAKMINQKIKSPKAKDRETSVDINAYFLDFTMQANI